MNTSVPKEAAPHGFDIAKGSTHMAVTREFVEFAVNDSRAQDLLDWMKDIKVPDEHFFQTLNHNPQMNIPGAYLGQFSNCIGALKDSRQFCRAASNSSAH